MLETQNELLEDGLPQKENVLFKKIIAQLLLLWPWLIVSAIVCMLVAYLYLKYSIPEYKVYASVLVQDDKGSSDGGGELSVLQDLGLLAGKSNVDNELEIFRSRTLMKRVVESNQLFITYYVPGKLRKIETLNKPIDLKFVGNFTDSLQGSMEYKFLFDPKDKTKFTLSTEDDTYKGRIGDTLHLNGALAVVIPSTKFNVWPVAFELTIMVSPVEGAVRKYMGRLTASIPNKLASIINLTLNEAIPAKGELVLNALINAYLQANVNDKNRIADSTIRFIDDRLALVFKELSGIEKDIEGFKTENKLTSIGDQARLLLENTSEYTKQQTAQEVQLAVVEALESFLRDNQNKERVVPSSLVMQDPSFVALIQRYNEMQLYRDKMLMSLNSGHPSVITMEEQLKNLREELLSSVGSVKRGIQVSVHELKKRTALFESQISKVPAKERVWLDYERQQAIKQELYLFLLKKREETAISKSSTLANARVIDPAEANPFPFKPKKSFIFILAFIIGIFIPFGISALRRLLNNRVSSVEDISNFTNAPLIAEIGHNVEESEVAVTTTARTAIAEQFRALRTNLNFLMTNEKDKVILITSSMSGEGKSFTSVNLSLALALSGRKVVLLELDLRKPKISESLKIKKLGITNYLIEQDSNWNKWVQTYGTDAKIDVLSSGPLPPNPAELLMLPKLNDLIEQLKKSYDYIIIDSAPVGLVTDAQVLSAQADLTLYVVRHGFTFRQQLGLIDKLYRKKALPRLNIVVNDVQVKKVGYGYDGYGYSYGYGFYGEYEGKKQRGNSK